MFQDIAVSAIDGNSLNVHVFCSFFAGNAFNIINVATYMKVYVYISWYNHVHFDHALTL